MKKRIAFVMDKLRIGGIEKALVELLDAFDYERYEVDLFLSEQDGELRGDINPRVQIYQWNKQARKTFTQQVRCVDVLETLKQIRYRLLLRINKRDWRKEQFYSTYTYPFYSNIYYDCVIAYQINSPSVVVSALKKMSGAKKIAFYHGRSAAALEKTNFWDKIFAEFDKIYCVSQISKAEFCIEYPIAKPKTTVFYNILNAQRVIKKAESLVDMGVERSGEFILTVGRLDTVKGQQMIPKAARILLDAGYDIHWYLVGDGPLRAEVEAEIAKYGVEDRVILLGTKSNPYPYMKNCDIYVQPSFSEGWGLTVQEAKILHKPIVVTPLDVMREQIVSGENGLIVDAMTPEAIAEGIRTLLDHPELVEKFRTALQSESHDNTSELQKLYDLIES